MIFADLTQTLTRVVSAGFTHYQFARSFALSGSVQFCSGVCPRARSQEQTNGACTWPLRCCCRRHKTKNVETNTTTTTKTRILKSLNPLHTHTNPCWPWQQTSSPLLVARLKVSLGCSSSAYFVLTITSPSSRPSHST